MNLLCRLNKGNNFFEKAYSDFSRKCLYGNPHILEARNQYKVLEDEFISSHHINEFFDRTVDLSNQLEMKGRFHISDLLINELSKLFMELGIYPNKTEYLLNWSLFNCRQKGDKIHELARLVDLEFLYQSLYKSYKIQNRAEMFEIRSMIFKTLDNKKRCCKEILNNYNEYAQRFVTINRVPTSKESVEIQLGITYGNLAKMVEKKRPQDALNMFIKARNIFANLGKNNETKFYEERIQRIKQNCYIRNGLPE